MDHQDVSSNGCNPAPVTRQYPSMAADESRDAPQSSTSPTEEPPETQRLRGGYAATSPAARELFDAEFLGQLEYLRIVSRRAFAGMQSALRRGLRSGPGLEFSEHRPYVLGDDFRYLDWAAYGRLDKLLLRLFQQDEDLSIVLLVDVSDSMLTGRPRKVDYARRLAAALAYIGLANLDRVRISLFADGEMARMKTRRGRGQVFSVLDFLAAAPLGGPTHLRRAVDQLAQHVSDKGLVVVVSDLLDPAGFEDGLGRLHYAGHEVWVFLLESPEDAAPPWQGEVTLADAETGGQARLRVTPEAIARYQERRHAFLARLEKWTTERGIARLRTTTDVAIDELVLDVFRRGGFLK